MILRKKPAESTVHNYLGFGIKGKELDDNLFARPHVNIIETDADDASKIECGVDEGHTGSSTMEIGTYEKSRSAELHGLKN